MKAVARLAAFGALLAAVLAVAAVIGDSTGIDVTQPRASTPAPSPLERLTGAGADAVPLEPDAGLGPGAGLAVAHAGMRIEVADPSIPADRPHTLRFRLAGAEARRVALTIVRRDARYLQRPAARLEAGGDWTARVRLTQAGVYRLIAEVDGTRVVGTDLFVPGSFVPLPVPAPATTTEVDGYVVRASGAGPGQGFEITARRGRRAVPAGTAGEVVAVRSGDLAYTSARPAGGRLRFRPDYPGPGTYRVFVPFAHGGRAHVAAFTRTVRR